MAVVLLLLLLLLFLAVLYWYYTVPKGLPPGSAGWPIVGYLPFIDPLVHITFTKLGHKFGKLFYLYLGNRLVIVLNDYSVIKEAFVKQGDIFSARPEDMNFKEKPEDNMGVIANDGEHWARHRRFMLSNLKDHGMGKSKLEPLLLDEIRCVMAEMRKSGGRPMKVKNLLAKSFANNVLILVTGQRLDYDHPYIMTTINTIDEFMPVSQMVAYHTFFPWIKRIPGSATLLKHHKIKYLIESYIETCTDIVNDMKRSYVPAALQDNYVHAYLTEQEQMKHDNVFDDLSLVHNVRDMIVAGCETSSTTVFWMMLYMTNYPEVATKCQQEISNVIGKDREPSYEDRKYTPYVEATLWEIDRMATSVPLALSHRNKVETTIEGHRIPKDTLILSNVWNVHRDPKLWGDPENFRPDRFVGNDGKVRRPEYLIPFGMGKRSCVGESLVRMEMYLYFTSFLQHFNFVPPDGVMPTLQSVPALTRMPKAQFICAVPRHN